MVNKNKNPVSHNQWLYEGLVAAHYTTIVKIHPIMIKEQIPYLRDYIEEL